MVGWDASYIHLRDYGEGSRPLYADQKFFDECRFIGKLTNAHISRLRRLDEWLE